MGRDEHKQRHGKNFLAQTPKDQKSDGIDVEFSEALADHADIEAQARSNAAGMRVRRRENPK